MQAVDLKPLNDHQILIDFSNGEKRLFDLKYVMNCQEVSETMKARWKIMVEKGNFSHVEILYGDVVWPGWVEILSSELLKFTTPFECEVKSDVVDT